MKMIIASDEKENVKTAFIKALSPHISIKHQELGDIICGKYIIERKTINDLYRSAMKGNLDQQLSRMKKFCDEHEDHVGILLIEGWKMDKHSTRVQRNIITKVEMIVSAISAYRIYTIPSKDLNDSIGIVKLLNELDGSSIIPDVRGYKRKLTWNEKIEFFLQGLGTIGKVRASEIMGSHRTVMDYFQWVIRNKKGTVVYDTLTKEMNKI
ncbi:hypothetical protein LCGC14_2532560 [marine sediment metagenome]|uniref:ERCC4 domain-containing protein n=1 Tax=marine sediment metagenome TaxID=412755 RepID=A0A0F9AT51_9ZZZZ